MSFGFGINFAYSSGGYSPAYCGYAYAPNYFAYYNPCYYPTYNSCYYPSYNPYSYLNLNFSYGYPNWYNPCWIPSFSWGGCFGFSHGRHRHWC